jgi:hypothetical protein
MLQMLHEAACTRGRYQVACTWRARGALVLRTGLDTAHADSIAFCVFG